MHTIEDFNQIVNKFVEDAAEVTNRVIENNSMERAVESDSLRVLVELFYNASYGSLPHDVSIEDTSLRVNLSDVEGGATTINVTVRNRHETEFPFKYKSMFTTNSSMEEIGTFFIQIFRTILENALLKENAKVLDELAEKVAGTAGLGFKVRFAPDSLASNRAVVKVSDEEVVFAVSREKLLSLEKLVLLSIDPAVNLIEIEDEQGVHLVEDEELRERYNKALDKEATAWSVATTPVELIAAKVPLLKYLVEYGLKRPATLVREVFSNRLEAVGRFAKDKNLTAFYLQDDVFGAVIREDGEFSVLLSPFNTKTLEKADVDLLAEAAKVA